MAEALPAASRHTHHLLRLLSSEPDRIHRLALRENQQSFHRHPKIQGPSIINEAPGNCKHRCIRAPPLFPCPFFSLRVTPASNTLNTPSSSMSDKKILTKYCPQEFRQRVWQVLMAVPYGRVATYGDIARLAGTPRAARQVGAILKCLPKESTLPWHRIVNHQGSISLTGTARERQRTTLVAEGVIVTPQGKISLTRYRWII